MSDPARKLSVVPPDQQPPRPPGGGGDDKGPEDDVQLTLMDHLRELRKRIIYSAYALVVAFGVIYGFGYSAPIYDWIMQPFRDALGTGGGQIVMTTPTEAFFLYMEVAAYASIFVVSPWVFYQFYKFVAPGLYRRERRVMMPFVVLGGMFFTLGGIFARYIILPFALAVLVTGFVSNATSQRLTAYLGMSQTLDFALLVLVAFGAIFELPLILTLLAKFGILRSGFLVKYRRHAIVVNTIIAAIITPTGDPFNLMLMAVPLWIFYELGIIGARFVETPNEEEWKHENPAIQAALTERYKYRSTEDVTRLLGGLYSACGGVLAIVVGIAGQKDLSGGLHSVNLHPLFAVAGPLLAYLLAGSYLRQLRPSGRMIATLLWAGHVTLAVLLHFHAVTIALLPARDLFLAAVLNTLLLALLWRRDSNVIFSAKYQRDIIALTGGPSRELQRDE